MLIDELKEYSFYVGAPYIQPDTAIIDLTTEDGDAIAPFVEACDETVSFVLCNALRSARHRFTEDPRVVISDDLKRSYPPYGASLTLSYFGMSRLPVSQRQTLVNAVYAHTLPGGVFLLVDHVLSESAKTTEVLDNAALSMNAIISEKPGAIPVPASWTLDMLYEAGFQTVEVYFKSCNVCAWLAVRTQ